MMEGGGLTLYDLSGSNVTTEYADDNENIALAALTDATMANISDGNACSYSSTAITMVDNACKMATTTTNNTSNNDLMSSLTTILTDVVMTGKMSSWNERSNRRKNLHGVK